MQSFWLNYLKSSFFFPPEHLEILSPSYPNSTEICHFIDEFIALIYTKGRNRKNLEGDPYKN